MVFSDLFFLFVFLPLFALLYLLAARRDRHDSLLLDSPQQAYKNHVLILSPSSSMLGENRCMFF